MKTVTGRSELILRFMNDTHHKLREVEFRLAGGSDPIKKSTVGTSSLLPDFIWGKSAMSLFHCLIRYAGNPPRKGEDYTHAADNADMFETLCQTLKRPGKLNDIFGEIKNDDCRSTAAKVLTARIFDAPNPIKNKQVRIRSEFLPAENIKIWVGVASKTGEETEWSNCVEVISKRALNDLSMKIEKQFNVCPARGKQRKQTLDEDDDLKDLVSVRRISEDLLKGLNPSLVECVKATRSRRLVTEEKDRPVFPGWKYNHFWGIGTVLLVTSPATQQPVLLWYRRQARASGRIPEPLPGDSVLFHANFTIKDPNWESPMDRWGNMEQIRQLSEFEGEDCATLRQLIGSKVKIPTEFKSNSHKMGVITRDHRKALNRDKQKIRVYTQYVFLMILDIPNAKTPAELQNIVVKRLQTPPGDPPVEPCFDQIQPEYFLTGRHPKPMDYLAIRALRGEREAILYEETQFTPNFNTV